MHFGNNIAIKTIFYYYDCNTYCNKTCKTNNVDYTSNVKYLGLILDNSLSGDTMATRVMGKINSYIENNIFLTPPFVGCWLMPLSNHILTMHVLLGILTSKKDLQKGLNNPK